MEEISGVAFIFNQKFFQDLKEETGGYSFKCGRIQQAGKQIGVDVLNWR